MKPTSKFAKLFFAFMAGVACSAQAFPSVDDLLNNLANDDLAAESAGHLAEYGSDPRTVPALRAKFLSTSVKLIKQSISVTMLRLKVADPAYIDYLASFAWEAVNDNAPGLHIVENRRPGRMNPEFEEWCKLHGRDISSEAMLHSSGYMGDLVSLIFAQDQRAAPIFRKGLLSNNTYVVMESALGLGVLGNPSDIEPIIEAADRSKEDIDPVVAKALSLFRNPRDRETITKRLQGSRLYDAYLLGVKADDKLKAEGKVKPN